MNNPTTDRLTAILSGLQAQLEGALGGSRMALAHPGARGEAAEENWLRLLREHLPNRYQADRAFVIDSQGACSDQIDVVIYDRQYSPVLYNRDNQHYVPAESVYAVLEVKQDLSRDHVIYAGQKAASVRRLHRTSAPIPYVGGVAGPRDLPHIIAGILTYQSAWSPPFGDPLQEVLSELPEDHRLELGCALVDGAFEARYPGAGAVDLIVVESPHSLVQLLMRLLKQLQGMATAPAIDYGAYLARFEAAGGIQS